VTAGDITYCQVTADKEVRGVKRVALRLTDEVHVVAEEGRKRGGWRSLNEYITALIEGDGGRGGEGRSAAISRAAERVARGTGVRKGARAPVIVEEPAAGGEPGFRVRWRCARHRKLVGQGVGECGRAECVEEARVGEASATWVSGE
jgi:hypothetical protein